MEHRNSDTNNQRMYKGRIILDYNHGSVPIPRIVFDHEKCENIQPSLPRKGATIKKEDTTPAPLCPNEVADSPPLICRESSGLTMDRSRAAPAGQSINEVAKEKEHVYPPSRNQQTKSTLLIVADPKNGQGHAQFGLGEYNAAEKGTPQPLLKIANSSARNLPTGVPLDPRLRKMGSFYSTASPATEPTVNNDQRVPTPAPAKPQQVPTPETDLSSTSDDPRIRYKMSTSCYSGQAGGTADPRSRRQQPYSDYANQAKQNERSSKSEMSPTQASDNEARSPSPVRDPRLLKRMRLDAERRNSGECVIQNAASNPLDSSLKAQQPQQNSVNQAGMARISTGINNISGSPNDLKLQIRATPISATSGFKVPLPDSPLPKSLIHLGLQKQDLSDDVSLSSVANRKSNEPGNSKKETTTIISEKTQTYAPQSPRSSNDEQCQAPKLPSHLSTAGAMKKITHLTTAGEINKGKGNSQIGESQNGKGKPQLPDKQHQNQKKTKTDNKDLAKDAVTSESHSNSELKNPDKQHQKQNKETDNKDLAKDTFRRESDSELKNPDKQHQKQNRETDNEGLVKDAVTRESHSELKNPDKQHQKQNRETDNEGLVKDAVTKESHSELKKPDKQHQNANDHENEAIISTVPSILVAGGDRSPPPPRRPPIYDGVPARPAPKKAIWVAERAQLLLRFERRVRSLPPIFTRQLGCIILNAEFSEPFRKLGDNKAINSLFEEGVYEDEVCDEVINWERDPFVPKECLVPERRIVVAKYFKTLVQIDKIIDLPEYTKCNATLSFIRFRLSRLIQWFFIVESTPRTEMDCTTDDGVNNFWNELLSLASYKCLDTKEVDSDLNQLEETAGLTLNRIQNMPLPTCNTSVLGTLEDHNGVGPEAFQSDFDMIIGKVKAAKARVKK